MDKRTLVDISDQLRNLASKLYNHVELDETDENVPKVITKDQLTIFSQKHASPCEACQDPIINHDWVLMDKNGFVLYCNITDISYNGTD